MSQAILEDEPTTANFEDAPIKLHLAWWEAERRTCIGWVTQDGIVWRWGTARGWQTHQGCTGLEFRAFITTNGEYATKEEAFATMVAVWRMTQKELV